MAAITRNSRRRGPGAQHSAAVTNPCYGSCLADGQRRLAVRVVAVSSGGAANLSAALWRWCSPLWQVSMGYAVRAIHRRRPTYRRPVWEYRPPLHRLVVAVTQPVCAFAISAPASELAGHNRCAAAALLPLHCRCTVAALPPAALTSRCHCVACAVGAGLAGTVCVCWCSDRRADRLV
jgi:hypothetical protein